MSTQPGHDRKRGGPAEDPIRGRPYGRREILTMAALTAAAAVAGGAVLLPRAGDREGSLAGPSTASSDPASRAADPPRPVRTDEEPAPSAPPARDEPVSSSTDMPAAIEPEPAGTSAPTAEPETRVAPVGGVITAVCRNAWGAEPARGGAGHRVEQLTLHHSGTRLEDNRQVPERLRSFQRAHLARGWSDLAYHWVVDAHGNVYEGRSSHIAGETATDYDPTGHLLVLCDGNFSRQPVPEAQLEGLAQLLAWAAREHGVVLDRLSGHRDHVATACPGTDLYEHLRSGALRERIAAHLERGPVELQLLCGQEARTRVRGIERG